MYVSLKYLKMHPWSIFVANHESIYVLVYSTTYASMQVYFYERVEYTSMLSIQLWKSESNIPKSNQMKDFIRD